MKEVQVSLGILPFFMEASKADNAWLFLILITQSKYRIAIYVMRMKQTAASPDTFSFYTRTNKTDILLNDIIIKQTTE